MTQDQRWQVRYDELVEFMKNNKRRPSKCVPEAKNRWN